MLKHHRKGSNCLVILEAWILLKHCFNSYVLDGSAPSIQTAIQAFKAESHLWLVGDTKGLAGLGLGRVP